jgi:hypothetical protein
MIYRDFFFFFLAFADGLLLVVSPERLGAIKNLINELRLENNKEVDEKKTLDSKASSIATYSVTFTVLLFGFGSFLLEKIETTNLWFFTSTTFR